MGTECNRRHKHPLTGSVKPKPEDVAPRDSHSPISALAQAEEKIPTQGGPTDQALFLSSP